MFNHGTKAFDYTVKLAVPWVSVTPKTGRVGKQVRATVRVDWSRAPKGTTEMPITVSGPNGARVVVKAVVDNPSMPGKQIKGFVEANGYISIDDQAPQIVNITTATGANDTTMNRQWERNTSDNANVTTTTHPIGAGRPRPEDLDGRPDRGGTAARGGHGRRPAKLPGTTGEHASRAVASVIIGAGLHAAPMITFGRVAGDARRESRR